MSMDDPIYAKHNRAMGRGCIIAVLGGITTLVSVCVSVAISLQEGKLTLYCLLPLIPAVVTVVGVLIFELSSWLAGEREAYKRYFGSR